MEYKCYKCWNNFEEAKKQKTINKLRTDELNIEPLKIMSDNNLWEIHHPHWRTTSDDGADDAKYQSNEIKFNAIQNMMIQRTNQEASSSTSKIANSIEGEKFIFFFSNTHK